MTGGLDAALIVRSRCHSRARVSVSRVDVGSTVDVTAVFGRRAHDRPSLPEHRCQAAQYRGGGAQHVRPAARHQSSDVPPLDVGDNGVEPAEERDVDVLDPPLPPHARVPISSTTIAIGIIVNDNVIVVHIVHAVLVPQFARAELAVWDFPQLFPQGVPPTPYGAKNRRRYVRSTIRTRELHLDMTVSVARHAVIIHG